MNRSFILISLLCIMAFSACSQPDSEQKEMKVKVKVINSLPVGWGIRYRGVITEIFQGDQQLIPDTIEFGITASKTYDYLSTGDIRNITFLKSDERNEFPYLPAINGMVNNKNEIWLIKKIEKTQ